MTDDHNGTISTRVIHPGSSVSSKRSLMRLLPLIASLAATAIVVDAKTMLPVFAGSKEAFDYANKFMTDFAKMGSPFTNTPMCGFNNYPSPVKDGANTRTAGSVYIACNPRPNQILRLQKAPAANELDSTPIDPCKNKYSCASAKDDQVCDNPQKFVGSPQTYAFTNDVNCKFIKDQSSVAGAVLPRFMPQEKEPSQDGYRLPGYHVAGETKNFVPGESIAYGTLLKDMKLGKEVQCGGGCDSGEAVHLVFKEKTAYQLRLHVQNSCGMIKICVSPNFQGSNPTCDKSNMMVLALQNSFVLFPNMPRAYAIQLLHGAQSPSNKDADFSIITIGYSRVKSKATFTVKNIYNEYVESDNRFASAHNLLVLFDQKNCLRKKYGIYSKELSAGFAYNPDADLKHIPAENSAGTVVVDSQATTAPPPPATTTEQPHVSSTTVAPQLGGQAMLAPLRPDPYGADQWLVWAFFGGYFFGTLLTVALGGGILFVLRRSFYSVWYRGMYKRYGCDASGTTGGVTGTPFGDTATGTMTIGTTMGGTTAGGTTAGTTGTSSTMSSATGGGSTTGGGTTGGGTTGGTTGDTLAM
ncbi:unnamed protein product [Caenorhabditis auriculariae]|uniref:Uncharacterized protein n=1 Tax=Caenorhabditis auriculariae TaxID=2777116 RepID=A0A8S1HS15_9PELO|nr:unnamed protein product [Caenorhabditis auriculariae]